MWVPRCSGPEKAFESTPSFSIVAIVFKFYGFLIVENPSLGPTDALKRASELTKGRIGELFVFGLALFGINLIGALLCGIGLLFTYGITAVAVAYAYRTLNGESVAPVPS